MNHHHMQLQSYSELWLAAISKAERQKRFDSASSVDYLIHLKDILIGSPDQSHRARWNEPPHFPPPNPLWENATNGFYQPGMPDPCSHLQTTGANSDAFVDKIASSMPMPSDNKQPFNKSNVNHYSVFDNDEDLSDEEIVYNPSNNNANRSNDDYQKQMGNNESPSDKHMSMRRILLRVYCSLAEIHSTWAVECSRNRNWATGADEFEHAYTILRSGQEIIDEEHALLAQMMETMSLLDRNTQATRLEKDIQERQKCIDLDSEVVSVPLAFFTSSKNKYVHAAQSRIAYLEDKLYENNSTRHEVMARMGSRWRNNPHPTNDYAERKKLLEKELEDALDGINRTQRMSVDGMGGKRRGGR